MRRTFRPDLAESQHQALAVVDIPTRLAQPATPKIHAKLTVRCGTRVACTGQGVSGASRWRTRSAAASAG